MKGEMRIIYIVWANQVIVQNTGNEITMESQNQNLNNEREK
jgi:hypothetical protein